MRENRTHGSEGGEGQHPSRPLSRWVGSWTRWGVLGNRSPDCPAPGGDAQNVAAQGRQLSSNDRHVELARALAAGLGQCGTTGFVESASKKLGFSMEAADSRM